MTPPEQELYEGMLLSHERERSVALESLKAALAEIERLNKIIHYWGRTDKELCARAADALETCSPLIGAEEDTDKLIAELRKAAK